MKTCTIHVRQRFPFPSSESSTGRQRAGPVRPLSFFFFYRKSNLVYFPFSPPPPHLVLAYGRDWDSLIWAIVFLVFSQGRTVFIRLISTHWAFASNYYKSPLIWPLPINSSSTNSNHNVMIMTSQDQPWPSSLDTKTPCTQNRFDWAIIEKKKSLSEAKRGTFVIIIFPSPRRRQSPPDCWACCDQTLFLLLFRIKIIAIGGEYTEVVIRTYHYYTYTGINQNYSA